MMQYRTDEGLPPLAPPDASDTERNRTIVLGELDAANARQVDRLLTERNGR